MYIKTAMIFFLAGLLLGLWILYLKIWGNYSVSHNLISAHTHLILFGFVIMLIMGVAYWMFPRPAKEDTRYSPNLAEINYWFITGGTLIRTVSELLISGSTSPLRYIVFTGALLQVAGGFVFVWNIQSRIRSVGSHIREKKGEKF